ncbi:MAG: winged helix-turn-helix domain-containing protein [Nitrososphaerales archaeon]
MQRKRGFFDIIASLLQILEEGACNKTALASRANLATRSSTSYVDILLQFNLVSKDESRKAFKLTEKGRMFLEEYKKLKMFIEE